MRYAFAHRGGRGHGRDNTLPTFTEAIRRGARALETDAWVTADGIVVLDHDGIHRAPGGEQQSISGVRRDQLLAHIPTLADLYDVCGTDFDLAIDVKGEGSTHAVLDVAARAGAAERLWLFTASPQLPGDVAPAHAGVTVAGKQLRRAHRQQTLTDLHRNGVEVVNARWPLWRKAAVDEVHALGMLAFAWDVQATPVVRWCRRLGIDGVFSDHIRMLHAAARS